MLYKASKILRDLEAVAAELIADGKSSHRIDIVDSEAELVVRANAEGFFHIATEALRLALNDTKGAHTHLDEAGLVDRCDKPVVLSRDLGNDV